MPTHPRLPLILVTWAALLISACTEAGIQQQFDAYLEDHRSCQTPEDCAVIFPGCPLGCAEVVSAASAEEAQALADSLIRQYEAFGRSCAYDCIEPAPVTCDAGTCAFEE